MTFFNKSYNEINKVDDPVIVPVSHKGSDDECDYESIFNKNSNNDYNAGSDDSKSESEEKLF